MNATSGDTAACGPCHTLISAEALRRRLAEPADLVLLDCGFDLADTGAGERTYAQGHLPGARYAHLDRDLSGAKTGRNGRHPLPERGAFAACVGRWGIGPTTQVVAYDAQGGVYAARAWWLLRWLGHDAVAVLDGGTAAWREAGGAMEARVPEVTIRPPYPAPAASAMPAFDAERLWTALGRDEVVLVDARVAERFRGEVEPLDPVAGRIPGAVNRFHKENLQADGRFKAPAVLRAEFERLGANGSRPVVHQCGSGVTACHNLLAMAHAGLPGAVLYPGSWSEWCADPARPVARG
ncbi:MAG: sulfurtransferase [Rubrivivax sp.]|nr:sulfurtransferase [Rubrivivax sp.]